MAEYRIFFRGSKGAIEARQGFLANDDAEAIECAALVYEACSDLYVSCELWSGARMVFEGLGKTSSPRFETLSAQRQQRTIDLEEKLRQSHWAVAKSQRLLKSIESARTEASLSAPRATSKDTPSANG